MFLKLDQEQPQVNVRPVQLTLVPNGNFFVIPKPRLAENSNPLRRNSLIYLVSIVWSLSWTQNLVASVTNLIYELLSVTTWQNINFGLVLVYFRKY